MTQIDKVRQHLEAGKSITPITAIAVYGISRLSSVIEDLRHQGYEIDCLLKRDEMGKQYGEYRLRKSIKVGSGVQVRKGYGILIPGWARSLKTSKVIAKQADASLVRFVRGKNLQDVWMNDKELINADH